MHEIGHCIGLDHEHQRPDRGEFIELIPENIPEDEVSQYKIIDDGSFEPIGRYDYDSIMHYAEEFLSRFKVLRLDEQPGAVVGQREKLSAGDVQATLFLYGFRAPRRVTFTATAVGDIRTRNVTLVNHLPRPITIATGPAAKPFKIVKKFPETAGPFRTVSATVEFRPLNAGKATATWALTIADIPVTVRVSGRGSGRIDPQ
jgi:hypothetical protein